MKTEPVNPGEGWRLLEEGEALRPGDGFLHPHYSKQGWIDHRCRPTLFTGSGKPGDYYYVPKNETAHTFPWRRRVE